MSVVFIDKAVDPSRLPADSVIVAVTAGAADAFAAAGVPHRLLCEFADGRGMAPLEPELIQFAVALTSEIESFVAEHSFAFDGPGFLRPQSYYLQYAIGAIATRTLLMLEAIANLRPTRVVLVDTGVHIQFHGDGYIDAPWTTLVEQRCAVAGLEVEILRLPPQSLEAADLPEPFTRGIARTGRRALRAVNRLSDSIAARSTPTSRFPGLRGMRILVVGSAYDWAPALAVLRRVAGTERLDLTERSVDDRYGMGAFEPTVGLPWSRGTARLGNIPPPTDDHERELLETIFDHWLGERSEPPSLRLDGVDLWPGLVRHIRSLTAASPALARQADAVATAVLDELHPDVACFFGMPGLASARLAHRCRERAVPVLSYQHGGSYGTHRTVQHELTDFRWADVFLAYGEGIRPRTNIFGPPHARFVPVGSARAERLRRQARPRRSRTARELKVIFVAEASFENAVGTFLVEDTERYRLECECLSILGTAPGIRVTYRPFPGSEARGGTAEWLSRMTFDRVQIRAIGPLDRLITAHDVVVSDVSSSTVWNETLALGVPLVLYCDPRQTPLAEEFMADLEQACHWCRTPDELLAALRRLADDGPAFVDELRTLDTETFLRKYVLHRDDGHVVDRVLRTLEEVRAAG
jgi:hypothetical protein